MNRPFPSSARPVGDSVFSRWYTASPVITPPRRALLASEVRNSDTLRMSGCIRTMLESIVDPHRPVLTMNVGGIMRRHPAPSGDPIGRLRSHRS